MEAPPKAVVGCNTFGYVFISCPVCGDDSDWWGALNELIISERLRDHFKTTFNQPLTAHCGHNYAIDQNDVKRAAAEGRRIPPE